MKSRIIAFCFLFCTVTITIVPAVYFCLKILSITYEVHGRIEHNELNMKTVTFKIDETNIHKFHFGFFSSKEFEFEDKMYDVVTEREYKNYRIVEAFADRFEDELILELKDFVRLLFSHGEKTDSKNLLQVLTYFSFAFVDEFIELVFEFPPFIEDVEGFPNMSYVFSDSVGFVTKDYTPPEFSFFI